MGERTGVPFAVEAPGRADAGRFSGKLAVVWVNQDPGDEIAEQTIDFPGILMDLPRSAEGKCDSVGETEGSVEGSEDEVEGFPGFVEGIGSSVEGSDASGEG